VEYDSYGALADDFGAEDLILDFGADKGSGQGLLRTVFVKVPLLD
jgi:hypothetical protein